MKLNIDKTQLNINMLIEDEWEENAIIWQKKLKIKQEAFYRK